MKHFTRRSWLQLAGLGSLVSGALHWRPGALSAGQSLSKVQHENPHLMGAVGRVSTEAFDPSVFLRTWNFSNLPDTERARFYRETPRSNGTLLREYEMFAVDRDVEIAPGVFFPAWTYNGQVPGPTLRANEGDRIRVNFINQGTHPHTIHFHGWHPPEMDGSMPEHEVAPGERFVYEFDAEPFGVHLYHCHSVPLKRHIHKGLYGAFIIDPPTGAVATRAPADELIMMLNSFDTNFDAENEVYAVNTVAHFHMHEPIRVQVGQLVRMYVINITEFDLLNSLHLHGMFFDVYRTGTQLIPSETTDTVMFCQGERMVLETTFRYPGDFMFHAHQSEFAELGWMGLFRAESDRRET
jgi:FtsP/CotA-like multicopper oxidase with cupredoxin domain|tara:strand:- start:1225 stop:2283 length:1059 start_codon:yes stop_codon:yes gene_type:complete